MFGVDAQGRTFLKISPPIRRTKVIPEPWRTNILVRGWRRLTGRSNPPKPKRALPRARWQRVGSLRRFILLLLMLAQTSVATYYMKGILPYQGWAFVDLEELAQQSLLDTVQQVLPYVIQFGILALFAILFCWVSAGFWTALMGFWELLTGRDRYRISGSSAGSEPIAADARTAIVMPICNEDVPRGFAGRHRRDGALRLLRPQRHQRPGYRRRRAAGLARAVPRDQGLRQDLLPSPPASGEAQERQHRRLLPALGRRLPLHGGDGRRQRDERRLPGQAGTPDGGQS